MALHLVDGKKYFNTDLLSCIEKHRNIDARSFFLDEDPNDLVDSYGFTLVHYAVYYKNDAMTRYFIDRGCNANEIDIEGNTALMYAVESNDRLTIEILLDAKADVFLCNQNEESVFHLMIRYLLALDAVIVKMLVQAGKKQCLNDNHALATKLLEIKLPFSHVVLFNDVSVTKLMLERGHVVNDVDSHGNTALYYAVALSDLEHVKMLIEHGIDLEYKNNKYLYGPLQFYDTESEDTDDKLEILKILMDHGATSTAGIYGNHMLEPKLFESGKKELIETLRQWDVDFNAKDENNKTLTHFMSANDNPGVLDLLRGLQFDINATDSSGRSAIWYAVGNSNFQILEYLLKNGAEVNGIDATGRPVLFYGLGIWPTQKKRAASIRCLELLLQHGADAQYVCNQYESVFHLFLRTVTRFELVYVVIAHLTMMEALGNPINQYIVHKIFSNRMFVNYFKLCKRQVQRFSDIYVYEKITLLDIFTESEMKLTRRVRNSRLAFGLRLAMWHMKHHCFAIDHYNRVYWERVIEALRCAELKVHAGRIIARVANVDYNHCVMDEIISNLDSSDLRNICLTNFY